MELIAQLKTVLKPDFLQEPEKDDPLILEEPQKDQEDTRVELIGVSTPFLAIRMRKLSHLSALREGDWRQICDYLLIGQSNGSDCAIFVELKKTLREEEKPKEQLRRSLPILEYLLSVCAVERGNSGKFNLTPRYILIAEKLSERLSKQPSRGGQGGRWEQKVYKSIEVTTFVGTTVDFAALAKD